MPLPYSKVQINLPKSADFPTYKCRDPYLKVQIKPTRKCRKPYSKVQTLIKKIDYIPLCRWR